MQQFVLNRIMRSLPSPLYYHKHPHTHFYPALAQSLTERNGRRGNAVLGRGLLAVPRRILLHSYRQDWRERRATRTRGSLFFLPSRSVFVCVSRGLGNSISTNLRGEWMATG
jgi:hypothetical protein